MGIRNILRKSTEKEASNKSLAFISRVARGGIAVAGVDRVRKQVIKGIESDFKRIIKKNPDATVESLMQDEIVQKALNTSDYIALLTDVGMGEEHLRLLAQEALDRRK